MALVIGVSEGVTLEDGRGALQRCAVSSRHDRTVSGFTFVELLIASTMIAVLIVGLAAHLKGGLQVWQRTTATAEILQRERVAMDRLERELASAIIFDDRDAAYGSEEGRLTPPEFGEHELRWFTTVPSTALGTRSVQFVTYTCTSIGDTMGLWRTSQSIHDARVPVKPPTPELILEGCTELTLRYAYLAQDTSQPLEWHTEWTDAYKELPRLIKVSLGISVGGRTGEGTASPQVSVRQVERILTIPVGLLKKQTPLP